MCGDFSDSFIRFTLFLSKTETKLQKINLIKFKSHGMTKLEYITCIKCTYLKIVPVCF